MKLVQVFIMKHCCKSKLSLFETAWNIKYFQGEARSSSNLQLEWIRRNWECHRSPSRRIPQKLNEKFHPRTRYPLYIILARLAHKTFIEKLPSWSQKSQREPWKKLRGSEERVDKREERARNTSRIFSNGL